MFFDRSLNPGKAKNGPCFGTPVQGLNLYTIKGWAPPGGGFTARGLAKKKKKLRKPSQEGVGAAAVAATEAKALPETLTELVLLRLLLKLLTSRKTSGRSFCAALSSYGYGYGYGPPQRELCHYVAGV